MSKSFFLSVLFFITIGFANAQDKPAYSTNNKKAIKLFEESDLLIKQRKFPEAIAVLEQAIRKDPQFTDAYLRMGSAYKVMANTERAKACILKAVELEPNSAKLLSAYFLAGEFYFNDGEYKKSKELFEKVLSFSPDKKLAEKTDLLLVKSKFAIEAIKNPVPFSPVKMPPVINKYKLHAFPVVTADRKTLIFTKRNGSGPTDDEDIMISHFKNGEWEHPISISSKINTAHNEGACTMSADGKVLVYSSCNKADGFGSCDLYITYREGDEWREPINMGAKVNSPGWDSEPSLSADGRTLYFSSERAGGLGREDIWVTFIDDNGEWAEAVNLGEPVNTSGREVTPFIHANGSSLYFASNQHPGMGGFDLFKTSKDEVGNWVMPQNLGYPINTQNNDNSIFITADSKKGYYSVYERKDFDEATSFIYEFDVPEPLKESMTSTYAQGTVYDAVTKKRLGASLELIDLSTGKAVQSVQSDNKNGEYLVVLTEGKEYALYVQRNGYLFKSFSFNYTSASSFDPLVLDVYLEPVKKGNSVVLNNIYFGFNSYDLEGKSHTELNKIVKLLENNPAMKIEFGGHTDDIGKDEANFELSMKRAKAVYDFVVSKGIKADRLSYKGYGETQPIVPNTNDENRQLNRRIEFKIM